MIDEIANEERSFQIEIIQQNELIENLKERINKMIEYQKKIKEDKEKENKLKKIRLMKQKNKFPQHLIRRLEGERKIKKKKKKLLNFQNKKGIYFLG